MKTRDIVMGQNWIEQFNENCLGSNLTVFTGRDALGSCMPEWCLNDAFSWEESRQGRDVWRERCRAFINEEKITR